jgi:hypothetical protein
MGLQVADQLTRPVVVGATGGSGTRAAGTLLQSVGVYLGQDLNRALDSLSLVPAIRQLAPNGLQSLEGAPVSKREKALNDFDRCLKDHMLHYNGQGPWGWKNPRSMLILPFLVARFPNMVFIHVVRDGRDMAISRNKQQLKQYGDGELNEVAAAKMWSVTNLLVAQFAQRLGKRYLRLRFEDFVYDPAAAALKISHLAEGTLPVDLKILQNIVPPESIGRHRLLKPDMIAQITYAAHPALQRFGYLDD